MFADKHGVKLQPVPELCTGNKEEGCVSWYPVKFPDCVSTPISVAGDLKDSYPIFKL